jgi:SAM-dependent methyltransferase
VTRGLRRAAAPLALVLVLAACGGGRAPFTPLHAPFVVTPEQVGSQMLVLAKVTARDVVYDLGSGDGRLVIEAARRHGARGVGVELDPRLVQESRDRALTEGVADRVTFLWQDLFATDLSPATVVTLYLGADVNLRLRPKLLREVAPGTRVVSHDFAMGDWRADAEHRLRGPQREHVVYLWTVPARVEGAWALSIDGGAGGTLTLAQRFQEVTGTLALGGAAVPVEEARVEGDRLRFRASVHDRAHAFEGRVARDRMEGRVQGAGGAPAAWSARAAR